MRRLYLEAVLRQEVHFFDAAPSSQSTTFGIITTISDDADTIQDFLSEKVTINCLHSLSHLAVAHARGVTLS